MKSDEIQNITQQYQSRYCKALKYCELAKLHFEADHSLSISLLLNAWEFIIQGNQDLGADNLEDKVIDFIDLVCMKDEKDELPHLLLNQAYESTKILLKYSGAIELSGQVSKRFYEKDSTVLNADGSIKNIANQEGSFYCADLLTLLLVRVVVMFKRYVNCQNDANEHLKAALTVAMYIIPKVTIIAMKNNLKTEGSSHRDSLLFS